MKYYLKIFLLSVGIGIFNVLMYLFLLQFQIVHNSGYVPQELFAVFLILIAIPVQFGILSLVAYLSKRNKVAVQITSALFILICFFTIWFMTHGERRAFQNEQVYRKTEKYDFQQGISTPEGYPIKLLSNSEFTVSVKGDRTPYTLLETNKVYSTNWGNGDNTFKSSLDSKIAVPDSLKLYWFSFLESKYYGLVTKLDRNKISQYFQNGYQSDNVGDLEKTTKLDYRNLTAGLAPGGEVVLWISGGRETREIAVFKAKEVETRKIMKQDLVREDEIKKVLSDTCTCEDNIQSRKIVHQNKPIPFGTWMGKYRKKFNWKVNFSHVQPTKSQLEFHFFNGENFSIFNEEALKPIYKKQVLPSYVMLTFIKNAKKYKATFQFDENEIYQHFETLTKSNPDEPVEMVLNFNEDFTSANITLKSKNQSLNFTEMIMVRVKEY